MKKLLILLVFMSSSAYGLDGISLYKGLKYKSLKVKKVRDSKWLSEKADMLEVEHDFHENVSYVGEDWDDVASYCDFDEETAEEVYNDSEVYTAIDWNKITGKWNRTKGYALFLFAHISSKHGDCLYPRGTYVIDKKGVEISDDELYKKYKIGFSMILDHLYLENLLK